MAGGDQHREGARRLLKTHPLAGVPRSVGLGVGLFAALILIALGGPLFWAASPSSVDVASALQGPSWEHPMGSDAVGRDVFARFLQGTQISLLVGLLVTVIGATVGGLVGILAATGGRVADAVLMRSIDAIVAFPPLVLAMAVSVGLGAGLTTAVLGVVVTTVPFFGRLIRTEVMSVRSRPFVEAVAALGAGRAMLVRRHVLPHVLPIVYVQMASTFGYAILAVAGLGFVGLGAQPPTAEWGTMLTDGFESLIVGAWWVSVFPGIGIVAAVTGSALIADGMRDHLDPRRVLP